MKKLVAKFINSAKKFLTWVWTECKDWHTIALLGIVCVMLGLPVWGGYLLGLIFKWEWAYVVATVVWGFWMLPGAPFFAISVSITLAIKKLYERRNIKKNIPHDPEKADDNRADP